jgi:hypothetical protein
MSYGHTNWYTSPGCARILEHLECKGPSPVHVLSGAVHLTESTTRNYVKLLHQNGVIHIHDWIRKKGNYGRVWAIGTGQDKERIRPYTNAEWMRFRREGLRKAYGREVAGMVLDGRRVVVSGRIVRPKDWRAEEP